MRYKEYNVNRVLDKSITLFWQKGFNGCSVNELVEVTGVNRFSLYHEFGNKEGILYASLQLYRERYCDNKLSLLKSNGELVYTLKKFYMSFLEDEVPVAGCYFIHTGTELGDSDPRVKESLNDFLNEIKSLFVNLLVQHDHSKKEAEVRAEHLLGLYCTAMSFCLIHTEKEREKYVSNGINIIMSNYA